MRNYITIIAISGCLSSLVIVAIAQPQGPPTRTSDVTVTSTISDSLDGTSMQIQRDGGGSYTNTRYVQSIVQGAIPDWELDTNYSTSSTRNVWLDFTRPVPGSGPNGHLRLFPYRHYRPLATAVGFAFPPLRW